MLLFVSAAWAAFPEDLSISQMDEFDGASTYLPDSTQVGNDYVVTGFREPTEELGTRPGQPRQVRWTRGDPAAREIVHDGDVSVFRLDGELDPATCGSGR